MRKPWVLKFEAEGEVKLEAFPSKKAAVQNAKVSAANNPAYIALVCRRATMEAVMVVEGGDPPRVQNIRRILLDDGRKHAEHSFARLVETTLSAMDVTLERPPPAQPRPLAHALGGEEWLEDLPSRLLVHANAGVAHSQHDETARSGLWMRLDEALLKRHVGCPNQQFAASRHRIPGVHGQIHEDLLDLMGVGMNHSSTRLEVGAHFHI